MDLRDLERRIRALEDIEAIKQLKYRYADACDRGYDADTLADLFTEDAIWDGGVFGRYDGQEAIRNYFRGVSSDIVFAMHYMMNPIIEVDGDEARGAWRRAPSPRAIHRPWAPRSTQSDTSVSTEPGNSAICN